MNRLGEGDYDDPPVEEKCKTCGRTIEEVEADLAFEGKAAECRTCCPQPDHDDRDSQEVAR